MGHLRKGGDLDAALLWLKEEDLPVMTARSGIGRGVGQGGGRYMPPPVASSSYSAHFSTPQALALAPMQVSHGHSITHSLIHLYTLLIHSFTNALTPATPS